MAQRVRDAFRHRIVRFALASSPVDGFALVEEAPAPAEPDGSGNSDDFGDDALLHFLAVGPDAAGRGIGRALLADAVEAARDAGYAGLVLDVRIDNVRAVDLYLRAGFVELGAERPHPLTGAAMRRYRLALSTP